MRQRRVGRYGGAWCARRSIRNTWLQFDFGGRTRVTRVCTQGRQNADQWVTSYYVKYSKSGQRFIPYREGRRTKVECSRFRSLLVLITGDSQPFYQSFAVHFTTIPVLQRLLSVSVILQVLFNWSDIWSFSELNLFSCWLLFRYLLVTTTDIS